VAKFTIKFGKQVMPFDGSAVQAARHVSKLASVGTFIRGKTIYEQPDNAQLPAKTQLIDPTSDRVLMTCSPSIVSVRAARAGRRVTKTFAKCDVSATLKKEISKRKRKRKR